MRQKKEGKAMKKAMAIVIGVVVLVLVTACGKAELTPQETVQQELNERIMHVVRESGFVVETSVRIMSASYNTLENGDANAYIMDVEEVIYLTVQARTRGGGLSTSDWLLFRSQTTGCWLQINMERFGGNNYHNAVYTLDVRQLNDIITEYWEALGIESSP